jgi:hypothetical protein
MTNHQQKLPLLISIIPNLVGGEGHIIPYHIALTSATQKLNWEHQILYAANQEIMSLPENWSRCLADNDLERETNLWGKLNNLREVIRLANSLNNCLKTIIDNHPNQDIIIFIERFIHLQLLALYLSLILSNIFRNNLFIWVLYRRDFHNHKTKFIYKVLNHALQKIVKKQHFNLFSDSQLLADSLSQYFGESITVMPIPHTEFREKSPNREQNQTNICWWAGPPREEKGWQTIRQLTKYSGNLAAQFTLVATKSSQLKEQEKGLKIILTDNNLSRVEYVNWLAKSDLILLPYDEVAYQQRTSGIFTESVIAGNIPVTRANTWMARELLKFDLEELIIDWENVEQVFEQLTNILQSQKMQAKLEIMRQEYRNFHNLNNFANQLKICYETAI